MTEMRATAAAAEAEGRPAAELSGVTKRFPKVIALAGLTLTVPKGRVLGLLGRNAAGKTTALRCLVGLERPDAGEVRVLGLDPARLDVGARRRIGYLAEQEIPFSGATVDSLIDLCAPLYPDWSRDMEQQILDRFRIDPSRKLRVLSHGQQRAVGLLLAVCPQPELLILDEPAANLDPVVRRELLEAVLALVGSGERTVIFSSHILSDVERVADHIAILHHGQLLLERPLDELKEQARRVRFVFQDAAPERIDIPAAVTVRRSGRELLATVVGYDAEAIALLAASWGAQAEAHPVPLEELFIDLVGEGDGATRAEA
jgi:ABC-2 type transport system ATP-binding protein